MEGNERDGSILTDLPALDGGAVRPMASRPARVAMLGATGIAVALATLWLARAPIADRVIARALSTRGIPARYTLARVGVRTQRIENLLIGDPARPDMSARWVEIDLAPRLGAPRITAIRAGGVRLRARWTGARLDLGALDRLRSGAAGGAALPDFDLQLADAIADLATPAGPVRIALAGRGRVNDGFAGRIALAAPVLRADPCRIDGLSGRLAVSVRGGRPALTGPVRAAGIDCGAARLAGLDAAVELGLSPGLDDWRAAARLATAAATVPDARLAAAGLRGMIGLSGRGGGAGGQVVLAALGVTAPGLTVQRAEIGGSLDLRPGGAWRLAGRANARGLAAAGAVPRVQAPGTPVAALVAGVDRLVQQAARGTDAAATLVAAGSGGRGALTIDTAEARAGSARLTLAGGEGVRLVWPGLKMQTDGAIDLTAPGLPPVSARLVQRAPGTAVSGWIRIAPYATRDASIAIAPVRLAGGRFSTRVTMTGPIPGGRIEGLALDLGGRIAAAPMLNPGCTEIGFARAAIGDVRLDPARARLCATGRSLLDGAAVRDLALTGRSGDAPLRLAATRLTVDRAGFAADGLSARLGSGDAASLIDVERLAGRFAAAGPGGRFAGLSGRIGTVPLALSGGAGSWRLAGGTLTVNAGARVADRAAAARFEPLAVPDLALTLADGVVSAGGTLRHPATGTAVATVAIDHDLARGRGAADLRVAGLRFGRDLQPEALTPLTLGVVASVDGVIDGTARIGWAGGTVTSSGVFDYDAASLAAAFGPVTGLKGRIRFTDLLGLVSAPDQRATIASVNPGVLVENGDVVYSLLPGRQVALGSATWPLAGGRISIRPTVWNFAAEQAREMTVDFDGIDAAQFIGRLEVRNLDATGIFDGVVPMVFDRDGGRIVGGILRARPPGGRIAYVGDVSKADLGIWGDIAFDALQSISYRDLTIALDGAVDGEMISRIRFEGVSRGTIAPVATGLIARLGGQLAAQVQRLPFRFNIRISAPFRGLMSSARSFYDPGLLLRDQLPAGVSPVDPPVQARVRPDSR